ncbi:MAG: fatty acid desaturase, partial [Bacteroidetes bacterium]|nr:fatty acid desaturase [Bacteroidota bacterium]
LIELYSHDDHSQEIKGASMIPSSILNLHFTLQIISFLSLFYGIYTGMEGWQYLLAAISTGICTGVCGIFVSHEMLHRNDSKRWRWMSKVLLFISGNMYLYTEHIVHHKWVGTWRDPATPRQEESVFEFFARSTWQQLRDAWYSETDRLEKIGLSELSKRNYVVANGLLQIVFVALINYLFGGWGVLVYIIQCVVANFVLEYTNYVTHYALQREETDEIDEKINWYTDKTSSQDFLIGLRQIQTDHVNGKQNSTLDKLHRMQNPSLPFGFATGFLIAILPPVWFGIVHLKMRQHKALFLK